jgi:hypothetical protein
MGFKDLVRDQAVNDLFRLFRLARVGGCNAARVQALFTGTSFPSTQASPQPAPAAATLPPSFRKSPGQEEGIGLVEVLDRVAMQVFVGDDCSMIAAPIQFDVDGIPKRSHYPRVPPMG